MFRPILQRPYEKVYRHPLIHVITDAAITEVSGYVGNFVTKVKSEGHHQRDPSRSGDHRDRRRRI